MKKVLIAGVIVFVVALVALRAAISPVNIGNEAISPTLKKGDVILVNRADRLLQQPLKHFDVVAIVPPYIDGNPYTPPDSLETTITDYTGLPFGPPTMMDVRRVIALPGETVVVRKDLGVFIDGKLLDESSYLGHQLQSDLFVLQDITKQSLDPGNTQPYQNSEAPIVVPPDTVFVLPDDRMAFVGSDMWGFIPLARVIGKVECKIANTGIVALMPPELHFATEKVAMNDDGVRALNKGEFTKAIQLFKSALSIDNNFELARDNLSIAYNNFAIQSVKNPEVALDSLHKALFLDPDNQLTKKNLAGVMARIGKSATRYEDRIKLADDALKRGKSISALVEYREAVKLNPNPAILAKVSSLEAQCNFPAHAIPEDQVKPTASLPVAKAKEVEMSPNRSEQPTQIAAKSTVANKAEVKLDQITRKQDQSIALKPKEIKVAPTTKVASTEPQEAKKTTVKKEPQTEKEERESATKPQVEEQTQEAKKAIAQRSHDDTEGEQDNRIAKKAEDTSRQQQAKDKKTISQKRKDSLTEDSTADSSPSKPASPISMPGALASLKADLDGHGHKKDSSSRSANQNTEEKQKSSYDTHNKGDQAGDKKPVVASRAEDESPAPKVKDTKRRKEKPDADPPRQIASITHVSAGASGDSKSHQKGSTKSHSDSSVVDTSFDTRSESEKPAGEAASKPQNGASEKVNKTKAKEEPGETSSRKTLAKTDSNSAVDKQKSTGQTTAKPAKSTSPDSTQSQLDEGQTQAGETKGTPLKPNPLKKEGFNLGTMMQNVFSGMTGKNSEDSAYRGPPLLKKPNGALQDLSVNTAL